MKKRGWMTRAQVREWLKGKKYAFLLRESSGPQFAMTGPVTQRRTRDNAGQEIGLGDMVREYAFAQTGTDIFSNPVIAQIIKDAEAGVFEVLVIAYASRFARDLHDAMVLLDALVQRGIPVFFIKEDVLAGFEKRWMSRVGKDLVNAHEFSDDLSEQRDDTIRSNWDSYHMPCGHAMFGHRWNRQAPSRIVLDDSVQGDAGAEGGPRTNAEWVRWIFEEYAKDTQLLRDLARRLNAAGVRPARQGHLWAKWTVEQLLKNPAAKGTLRFHVGRPDEASWQHEDLRIVDDALFDKVAQVLRRRQRGSRGGAKIRKYSRVLRDIASCARCGRVLVATGPAAFPELFHGKSNREDKGPCEYGPFSLSELSLEAQISTWMRRLVLPPDALAIVAAHARHRPQQPNVERQRQKLEDKRQKVRDAYFEAELTREQWEQMRVEIDRQIASLPPVAIPQVTAKHVELIQNLGELFARADRPERRRLCHELFEEVRVGVSEAKLARMRRKGMKRVRGAAEVRELVIKPQHRELVAAALAYASYVGLEPSNSTYLVKLPEIHDWLAWFQTEFGPYVPPTGSELAA